MVGVPARLYTEPAPSNAVLGGCRSGDRHRFFTSDFWSRPGVFSRFLSSNQCRSGSAAFLKALSPRPFPADLLV